MIKTEVSQFAGGSQAEIMNQFTYNELGQAVKKKIHSINNGSTFLQEFDYGYNIKGALTDINNINDANKIFSLKLNYNPDGNIVNETWRTAKTATAQSNNYQYDNLNRLTGSTFTGTGDYGTNYTFDKNGNILTLQRKGQIVTNTMPSDTTIQSKAAIGTVSLSYKLIDNLTYTYTPNSNKLLTVSDKATDINTELNNDFREASKFSATEYFYDANGNMTKDLNKGITVAYNVINLPVTVSQTNNVNNCTEYVYATNGTLLRTKIYVSCLLKTTTDYCGAFEYENSKLKLIHTPEGRIAFSYSSRSLPPVVDYEYDIKDHLGNVRLVIKKNTNGTNTTVVLQENHYYAFGLQMSGMCSNSAANDYLYNGKEKQEQTGWYNYGFRQLDAVLGRWHVIDAMAESFASMSPYVYGLDNPINVIDVMGLYSSYTYAAKEVNYGYAGSGSMDFIARGIGHARCSGSGSGAGSSFSGGISEAGPGVAEWDEAFDASNEGPGNSREHFHWDNRFNFRENMRAFFRYHTGQTVSPNFVRIDVEQHDRQYYVYDNDGKQGLLSQANYNGIVNASNSDGANNTWQDRSREYWTEKINNTLDLGTMERSFTLNYPRQRRNIQLQYKGYTGPTSIYYYSNSVFQFSGINSQIFSSFFIVSGPQVLIFRSPPPIQFQMFNGVLIQSVFGITNFDTRILISIKP